MGAIDLYHCLLCTIVFIFYKLQKSFYIFVIYILGTLPDTIPWEFSSLGPFTSFFVDVRLPAIRKIGNYFAKVAVNAGSLLSAKEQTK